jgi:hypothetical protein
MSDQIVTDGLRVKLAEIATAIRTTEQRLRKLTADKATIAGALRLFDLEPTTPATTLGIKPGTFTRTILETLRDSPEPLSARQLAERLAERAGHRWLDWMRLR